MNSNDIKQGAVIEIFDWYDGPLNYTLKGLSGQLFYATYMDCQIIDGQSHSIYLYIPTTPEKVKNLLSGGMDIRDFHANETVNGAFVETGQNVQFYTQVELLTAYPLDDWSAEVGVRFDKEERE